MPLTLSRQPGQNTLITVNGERVIVALRKISGKRASLTFYAAPHVKVIRGEVEERDAKAELSAIRNAKAAAKAAMEETQDIILPTGPVVSEDPPFVPGDLVRYRGTTTPLTVRRCYRSAVDGRCHWIVQDWNDTPHYAAHLERIPPAPSAAQPPE